MPNLALSKLGFTYAYLGFDVDENNLEAAVNGFRAL
jgi:shikimate 5-dehydrogenase